ncbi:alpha-hydroxy acid oxidase [Streptomyces chartreusis]|uniref:Alpha-hydroxy-acid oxidizing protein n=1 Tax=Streptomyces chartreusis TaxID=1969 RepID=A0A7I0NSV7_STRCX|nr:alpha-hydroxy acid oxidase [Streptomyces chartreusis]QKZ16150.1 alpha-hydroxy-acid oxidizing protein [Streptomyces chartreusis]
MTTLQTRLKAVRSLTRFRAPSIGSAARVGEAHTIDELREVARRRVPRPVLDYVDGGSEDEIGVRRARAAFERVEFVPRVLSGAGAPDTSTVLLGRPSTLPVALAPTGFTRMMHHAGECAVAAAAAATGVPYALSTLGTASPEQVAAAAGPDADLWFQLYPWRDRKATEGLVERAAGAGFRVLVLTVDTPVAGDRRRDRRNGFQIPPSLTSRSALDIARRPRWWINLLAGEPLTFASLTTTAGAPADLADRVFDPFVSMEDLAWLRRRWQGPLVVKGVLDASQARKMVDNGADAVIVSHHGGRQLDRVVTPLEALPAIADEVGSDAEVYIDGGVRSGADVAAAVGLGARACLIGRAYLYGLMAGGRPGVDRVLEIFGGDLERTMALTGCHSVSDLRTGMVRLRTT